MIAKASLKHLRTSPQKVRLVVDQIRGKAVGDAMQVLQFSRRAVARDLEKLLKSAVANAEQREERVDVDDLCVRRAVVDTGPTQKRIRYRAMGRVFRILKRSSHVTLELDLNAKARRKAALASSQEPVEGAKGRKVKTRKTAAAPAATKTAGAKKKTAGKKTAGKKKVTKKKAVKKEKPAE